MNLQFLLVYKWTYSSVKLIETSFFLNAWVSYDTHTRYFIEYSTDGSMSIVDILINGIWKKMMISPDQVKLENWSKSAHFTKKKKKIPVMC